MAAHRLVPPNFPVPHPPQHASFEFEVLGPEHNASDLAAWTTSIAHIHASPGWSADGWPDRARTLDENRADLERHRDSHERCLDFAWTVLAPGSRKGIGCVYLKPDPTGRAHSEARSWVRADRAALDRPLREHLGPWFERAWPIDVRYAPPA